MSDSSYRKQEQSLSDNQDFIKDLFDRYYIELVHFSMKYVVTREIAEEIVQDIFVKLWNDPDKYKIDRSVKGYLFTSVKNSSLNYLKSKFARIRFVGLDENIPENALNNIEADITAAELNDLISHAVDSLPPKCKIIFSLSRNAGLSYDEIAGELKISKRTVEAQINIAIKRIKAHIDKWWDHIPS